MQKIKLTEEQIKRVLDKVLEEQADFFENPFKNKVQGDAFRGWVNDTYPDFAKEIQLSRSGRFNNSFINKALKQPLKLSNGRTTSMMTWYMSKNPNWATGNVETKKKTTPTPVPPKKDDGKKIPPNVDQSNVNSYPECVRAFGKPAKMKIGFIDRFFGNPTFTHSIPGKNFYQGYYFTADGKYILSNDEQKSSGTYGCQNGKIVLDIANTANQKSTLTSGKYKYSPRIDAEVKHIQNRGLDKSPFFVYDPKDNLIYLFDEGSKYVASSSVVDGENVQKSLSDHKGFTYKDWCGLSNLGVDPYVCTNPKTGQKADPEYWKLGAVASKFLPKGIYTITGLHRNAGYSGGGKNSWSLKPIKLEGTITSDAKNRIPAAIHGIPNIEGRLTASKDLEQKLKSDINGGKVPREYLGAVKSILAANQSAGCVGIPASFVDSPKVQSILKKGNVQVFAMGESSDMLVKNNQPQGGQTNVA